MIYTITNVILEIKRFIYQNDTFWHMSLLHIRVGKELKKQIQKLIDVGLFSNQAEVAREAIRDLLLKY